MFYLTFFRLRVLHIHGTYVSCYENFFQFNNGMYREILHTNLNENAEDNDFGSQINKLLQVGFISLTLTTLS